MAKEAAAAQPENDEHLEIKAPFTHLIVLAVACAPLLVGIPANINIVLLPTLTIFAGAWRSVKLAPPVEAMTQKDAMQFPLIGRRENRTQIGSLASHEAFKDRFSIGRCVLFSLFIAFKFLPKELLNLVLSFYFGFLGVVALAGTAAPFIASRLSHEQARRTLNFGRIPKIPYLLDEPWELACSVPEAIGAAGSSWICVWYMWKKHWLANNLLGLAFSIQGIEHLSLGSTKVGALLLVGLFFYDIFWVFCTPVMVSVAKQFDAPIKLLFRRLDAAPDKSPFSMLGLGDIVIPGFFIALMLRFDVAKGRTGAPVYFRTAMVGYVLSLSTTIAVMNLFNAAQPALLYIVPGLLLSTAGLAAARGEVKEVFTWEEVPEEAPQGEQGAEGEKLPASTGAGEAKKVK